MCFAAHLPAPENQGFAVGTMRWACGVPFHMTYGPHTNTMRDTIRVRLARGEYDRETSGFAFALRLTNDPLADARQCGFEKVSVMEGGIGYLKLNRGHALVLQNRGPMCGRLSRPRPLSTGRDGQVCGACTTSEAPMTISTNRQRRVLPLEDARVAYLDEECLRHHDQPALLASTGGPRERTQAVSLRACSASSRGRRATRRETRTTPPLMATMPYTSRTCSEIVRPG
jgi:hypothetical protein